MAEVKQAKAQARAPAPTRAAESRGRATAPPVTDARLDLSRLGAVADAADGELLVDGVPGAGQLSKTAFLAELREQLRAAAEQELAGTDWTTQSCPWFDYWFSYYAARSASELEAAIRKYARVADAHDATDYLSPIVARVRTAIARWRRTGEIDAPVALPAPERLVASLGPGEPLPSHVRSPIEDALGADLSATRVHADHAGTRVASDHAARAVAIGTHVAFAEGAYRPGTQEGDALLAHELAHTVQQRNATTASAGHDAALEAAADQVSIGVLARLWNGTKSLAALARRTLTPAPIALRLQRCAAAAKAPDNLATMTVAEKAAWITQAMSEDRRNASDEIAKVFLSVSSPAEFLDLQKLLDMQKVLEFEDDFGASMIGSIGPVLAGADTLNEKRVSFIKYAATEYTLPVADIFVLYLFQKMFTDQMRVVLKALAADRRLADTIGQMPLTKKVIEDRGLAKEFSDRKAGGMDFVKGFGSELENMATSRDLDDAHHTSVHMGMLDRSKLLPPTYTQAVDETFLAVMEQAFHDMLTPSNLALGMFDNLTMGIPHGIYSLITNTVKGGYHLGTGDYDKAGHELAGALVVVVTYASGKIYTALTAEEATTLKGPKGPGQFELKSYSGPMSAAEAKLGSVLTMSAEGEALATRVLNKLGPEGVKRVASYIQADSKVALFIYENGEAGIYALERAGGDLAAARNALPKKLLPAPAAPTQPPPPAANALPDVAAPAAAAAATKATPPAIQPGDVGTYPTTIEWGIQKKLPARPAPPGFWGKRTPQAKPRVDAYERKINPNNESYYLPHPEGGFVQFENVVNGVLEDGKLVLDQDSLFLKFDGPKFKWAKDSFLKEARRQVRAAEAAGLQVEWKVSDPVAVQKFKTLFAAEGINIDVTLFPE